MLVLDLNSTAKVGFIAQRGLTYNGLYL